MELPLFFRGVLMGLAIAAPVGPIGVLCIRQTLTYGLLTGFVSGLGAATADGIYGSIAGFGLSAITGFLTDQQDGLKLIGGIFLCYLGVKTSLSRVTPKTELLKPQGHRYALFRIYGSTLFLTLTNPATILSFTAIFAGLGIANHGGDYGAALRLVAGVFSGSALWWLTLSGGVNLLRQRFTMASFKWVNRLSGAVITAFGIVAIFV